MADTTDTSGGITAAIQAIVKGIQKVVDKIDAVIDWFFELIPRLIEALVLMYKDMFLWCLEQLLSLAKGVLDGMTGFDDIIAQAATIWAGVPPEVMTVVQAIGLGTALTIITGAIMIRLVLQLIPFVRLGS
ncbi:DUF2523 family protein [Acidovorax sp. 22279]|uniref:DUF2523 family protein n=1 Tax=Acidovorax sp. 22279 TaxID=3453900 RepID=UPI003F825DBE